MADEKGTVTLFENESYLVWKDTDEGMIHFIMAKRGITLLFCKEEWHEFSRTIVSAANQDCETVAETNEQIMNKIDQMLGRIDKLEQGHESIGGVLSGIDGDDILSDADKEHIVTIVDNTQDEE